MHFLYWIFKNFYKNFLLYVPRIKILAAPLLGPLRDFAHATPMPVILIGESTYIHWAVATTAAYSSQVWAVCARSAREALLRRRMHRAPTRAAARGRCSRLHHAIQSSRRDSRHWMRARARVRLLSSHIPLSPAAEPQNRVHYTMVVEFEILYQVK